MTKVAVVLGTLVALVILGWRGWQTFGEDWLLFSNLKSSDPATRSRAVQELKWRGVDYTANLLQLLDEEDPNIRIFACDTLSWQKKLRNKVVIADHLTALLDDESVQVRRAAIGALQSLKIRYKPAESKLIVCLNDEDQDVRFAAACLLYDRDHDNLSIVRPVAKEILSSERFRNNDPYYYEMLVRFGSLLEE